MRPAGCPVGSWLCASSVAFHVTSRSMRRLRAGGDEGAGVGEGTSGRGPQRGVGTLAGPCGDDAEGAAGQPLLQVGRGRDADDEPFHGEQPDEADGDRRGLVGEQGAETGAGGTEQGGGGDAAGHDPSDVGGGREGDVAGRKATGRRRRGSRRTRRRRAGRRARRARGLWPSGAARGEARRAECW